MPRLTKLKAKRIALKNPRKQLILLNKKRFSASKVAKASKLKDLLFVVKLEW